MAKNSVTKIYDSIMEWSVYLLIFFLPFAKAGIEILAGFAIVAWALKKFTIYKLKFTRYFSYTPLNGALFAFVIANILSTIISINYQLSTKAIFSKVFEYVILYFVVVEIFTDEKKIRNTIIVLSITAVLMILDSSVQYFRGKDFLRGYAIEGRYLRASFSSHNGFGGWLLSISPIFLCLSFSKEIKKFFQRMGFVIVGISLFICLLATYSRGAWIGFLAAMVFILIFHVTNKITSHRTLISLLAISCAIVIVFILPVTMKERLASVMSREGSGLSRINAWQESLSIIEDYPLFGAGLNTYSFIGPRYKMFEGGGIYPHNSLLQMTAEIGILGLICFVWIVVELFRSGIDAQKNKRDMLLLGILAGIAGFLAQCFFDNNLYALQLSVLLWLMVGLAVARINLLNLS